MSQLKVDTIRHTSASSDAITLASDGTATANITNPPPGNRNLIINGAMDIWQRGNGPYTIAYAYSADRWERNFTLSGSDYYHIEKKTESPPGFASSLEVSFGTVQSSVAANQYAILRQKIEAQNLQQLAYGTSSAKKMTLSFWVRSNKTGTYALNLQQQDNSSKMVSFNYSISSADTWEKKTISIPADTSGVINNDNGEGITVTWHLVAGSDATSGTLRNTAWTTYAEADQAVGHNVNIGDSTSNTWYITGVQLEVGDYATDFEHRSYGDELFRCKRYYQTTAQTGTEAYKRHGIGYSASTSAMYTIHYLNPPMRAVPAETSSGNFRLDGHTTRDVTSITYQHPTQECVQVDFKDSGGGMNADTNWIARANNDTSARINFDAEL